MSDNHSTFSKTERLHSQREIDLLFQEGKSFVVYPLRVIYLKEKTYTEAPAAMMVSVSKKRFKRAVKRNLLKRRVREAYRKNKHSLIAGLDANHSGMLLAFLYIGNEIAPFSAIEQSMNRILGRLLSEAGKALDLSTKSS